MTEPQAVTQVGGDPILRILARLANDVRGAFPHAVDISLAADRDDRRRAVEQRDVHGSPHELFARYLDDQGAADEALTQMFATLLEEEHAADAP